MLKSFIASLIMALLLVSCDGLKTDTLKYTIANTPWEEEIEDSSRQKAFPDVMPTGRNHRSLGNHRALIRVSKSGAVAHLDLEWRRHDQRVERPRFILIHKETQDTVKNIYRVEVYNEHCELLFGPVEKGVYYFYYLPFEKQGGWGGYYRDYLPVEPSADERWMRENSLFNAAIQALALMGRRETRCFHARICVTITCICVIVLVATARRTWLLYPCWMVVAAKDLRRWRARAFPKSGSGGGGISGAGRERE